MSEHRQTLSPSSNHCPQPAAQDMVVSPDTTEPTVCLVDDDPSVLKATSRLLCSAGWKVKSFTDPIAFLHYAKSNHPKIAVLDIRMPKMNGFEVQTELRSVSPLTRAIMLTSKDDPSVRSKAIESGAAAFFLKPLNGDEFLAGIESTLGED